MRLIKAKTILSPTHNVNLYRGCTHGCIYCDARSDCYQVGDFESVAVKENAIEILGKELSRKRQKKMIFTGGMSDPYVHLEQKLGLTKAMLNLIDAHHFPVSILTKSDMLLRDLTLLKRINQKTKAVVCFTITTFDDALCLKLEPHVCPTSKRLEALRQCHEAGITTGIWLTPILPFINDTETNIKAIVQAAHDVGVSFIINFGMGTTMRAGSREPFYENLDRLFPGMKLKYQKTFGNHYVCPSPKATQLETVFRAACDERNILYKNKDIQQLLTPKTPTQLSLFEE